MSRHPYLAILLAALLGVGAFVTARPAWKLVSTAQRATAKVVDVYDCTARPARTEERGRLDRFAECADITFLAASGRLVVTTVRGWPGRFDRGELRDVLYDPMDPDRAHLDSRISIWSVPVLLGVAAVLVLLRGTVGMGRG
jgi:hypothetical protein